MSYYVPKKDLEDLKEIKPSTANIRNRDLGRGSHSSTEPAVRSGVGN